MSNKYIAIAGNMGAGKSSLVEFLCSHFGLKPFFEPHLTNPFLELFYQDMKRWAFHSQMYYLSNKFRIHRELDTTNGTVVQDRTIFEDAEIFAENLYRQGHMSEPEYETYRHLYETMLKAIQPPDILLYLECPVKALKTRIAKRGRGMEQSIPDSYIRGLHKLYTEWIDGYKLSPVIRYSTEKQDYLSDFIHRQDLLSLIEKHLV
ncbi:MAG: deoxynucleoside kinase [Deltaproteobacteria bacterium]|nr:deoxynucleoside kinase [Deltaproteobacteria bacterium]